jgi:hypothetical protein
MNPIQTVQRGDTSAAAEPPRERSRSPEFAAALAQYTGAPLFSPWPPAAPLRADEPAPPQSGIAQAPDRRRREGRQRSR